MKNTPKNSQKIRRLLISASSTFFLLTLLFGLVNYQFILDQISFWSYEPSQEIARIAHATSMTETGKFRLYSSHASVVDRQGFNKNCGSLQNEKTVILGCYTPLKNQIFIFDVANPELKGIKEVTAAHEMLHSAYSRLTSSERKDLNDKLMKQRSNIKNEHIINLIKSYEEAEPGQVENEMHSIFGTEVANLSPELEEYYKKFFKNRSVLVDLKNSYQSVFDDLRNHQDALVKELNSLASSVNDRQPKYQQAFDSLNKEIEEFNSWADSGSANQNDFYSKRNKLQAKIKTLENERVSINADIDSFNSKKNGLDKLNLQAEDLQHSIDSKLPPGPSL